MPTTNQRTNKRSRRDYGARAAGKCAVVLGVAPVLRAAFVCPEAIVAEGQRKRRPTAGVRGLVVARIDCPGEGIDVHPASGSPALSCTVTSTGIVVVTASPAQPGSAQVYNTPVQPYQFEAFYDVALEKHV